MITGVQHPMYSMVPCLLSYIKACYCTKLAPECEKSWIAPGSNLPVFYKIYGRLHFFLLLFSSLISLIADGLHHYHPACGHKGSSHLSPVHALQFFYRDASSALLQLVNQWLNFTYSRSHAFRYERKDTNPTLVRIELTTSALAGMYVCMVITYSRVWINRVRLPILLVVS